MGHLADAKGHCPTAAALNRVWTTLYASGQRSGGRRCVGSCLLYQSIASEHLHCTQTAQRSLQTADSADHILTITWFVHVYIYTVPVLFFLKLKNKIYARRRELPVASRRVTLALVATHVIASRNNNVVASTVRLVC